jgi:predicted transposase YbfD/YdcC
MAAQVAIDFDDLAQHFEQLDDPRSDVNQRHPFTSVVAISLMAVLAGAGGPTAIAEWAKHKAEWLEKFLPLPHGIPRKDVFRRVLSTINPQAFQACFGSWLQDLCARAQAVSGTTQPLLAIDGKTLRRSHDRNHGLGALHSVSVWAADYGLTLAQVACDEKSNEITAIPELLKLVHIAGAIITIDAMGTQKKIARQIVEGGGDFVLALKGNQGTLHNAVIAYVNEQLNTDFRDCGARRHVTKEKGHGRRETRMYVQMPVPEHLKGVKGWTGLKTIGVVMLMCLRGGKETCDVRYYISSLPLGVRRFARAVRGHWGIENSCHWSLDFTYREDESRIRETRLRENFAWLNRFTHSLLKQHPGRQSLVMKRRICGWNDTFLMQVLAGKQS